MKIVLCCVVYLSETPRIPHLLPYPVLANSVEKNILSGTWIKKIDNLF